MGYTSLVDEFSFKDLLTFSLMDQLAENTAFDTFPSGTAAVFFQAAAPAGWTKDTDNNDALMRVVSGDGGGAAGSSAISSPTTHTHSFPAHTHAISDNNELPPGGAVALATVTTSNGAGTSGGTAGFIPKYIDALIATKDAA